MSEPCEYLKLYGGALEVKYCDDKHIYHVRPAPGSNFVLNEPSDGKTWMYTPSVTSITRMLGGGKVSGLLYWAVDQTLIHLDNTIEDGLIVPAVEKLLDCFTSRISESWDLSRNSCVPTEVLDTVLGSLDNCVGMDEGEWKDLRKAASKARDVALSDAANIGHLVHAWIEGHIKYRLGKSVSSPAIPADPVTARAIKRFLNWEEKNHIEWLMTEQRVYSNAWHYTGTLDALAKLDGELTLIDFKTSKRIYDEHLFQTAAYVKALEEEYNVKVKQRMVMRLSKTTGSVTPTILDESTFSIDDDFAAFIGLRGVYRRLKGA